MRRDIFIPEALSAEEKVALFVEAINVQDMNAVVVSPKFFEEVKRNPKVTVEYRHDVYGNEAEDTNMADTMIENAIDLLYKYEGVVAYTKEPATIDGVKLFVKPVANEFEFHN